MTAFPVKMWGAGQHCDEMWHVIISHKLPILGASVSKTLVPVDRADNMHAQFQSNL